MNNLGKNLYYLRKQKGLLQDQIKNHLGISRTTWSNYENSITEPSIDGLIQISSFFGISIEKLIMSDLEAENGRFGKIKGSKKIINNQPYEAYDEFPFAVQEEGLSHIMQELKKLREEVNMLKKLKKKG